jgi:hypothetical protein
MMSRSMYQFIPEILDFKNVEGRLMVLYDLEERLAVSVATNWFEKGIENFAVLTGKILPQGQVSCEFVSGPEACLC